MAFAASSSLRSAHLRRLPLPQAIQAVRSGEGSTFLPSSVQSLTLRFVQRNAPSGPLDFVKTIAPRLAYANPALRFNIERIPDPRDKSKDPESPHAGATWPDGKMPSAELRIGMEGKDEQTIMLEKMDAGRIYQELLRATGANGAAATFEPLPSPFAEA